jgi:tetratricopeptide (TPR) repeat protein
MPFPRRLITLAILLVAAGFQFSLSMTGKAQNAQPVPPPQKSTQKSQSSQEKEPDYSQEALVIEQLKTSYRFEKDGTGQHDLTLRVRVQSEAALERFGQLVFPYSSANEKLDIDYVRVKKANGTAVTASPSDVQDLTAPISREAPVYTDLRQKHVTVPGLRPGDTLEYHIVWQLHTPLAPNHFWLNHDFITKNLIVLDEQLEVNIPSESSVKLKAEKGFEPAIKEQEGRRIYNWKHAVLKREEEKDDDKAAARKRREELEDPKPPQVQMTTFKTWDEVGQWYAGLERDRIVPDDKIRAKAEELVRGRNNDKEKIEALYEYVAKNFRYVSLSLGQGRYQPHAASDVLANEYGDCKDKHTLLSAMLIAAGLRAYPALMNSSRKIDPDVPSPAQFDHVISFIPLGSETLWADTTAEVAPFRLLSPQLRDKKALVILTNSPALLQTTPAEPPFVSTELVEIVGQVNDLGQLKGHAHMTLRGDAEMEFRFIFRRTPKSDWKQLGYVLTSSVGLRGGEATEIKPTDPAALEKPFEVEFDFSNDDFLDWSSKKAKLSLPMPTLSLATVDPDKDENSKPILLGAPIDATYRLRLTLPAKYEARAPVPLTVSRDYANYSSRYKLEGSVLVAERSYHLRQHELSAARAQDYSAFAAATRSDEAQTLSVETSVAGAPTVPDTVKVEELEQAAEAAIKNDNYPVAEALFRRVLEKDPKHKTARRQLAYALFLQRKLDDAIAVLREQTKINPFDDYAYNLLGQVFWRQQNYAEAEGAFRKQIEVTPLDQWAHGNLGLMLVDWRKYKEAVPELEQAISLNPDQEAGYQISLGRAYLNLGAPEKATQAFDKAVKLQPGQRTWNDVAYFLAVGKVQLEKAQQYAESAVTEVATDLRNVELERLTIADLANVASLAADWDTLGWVHFQKGEIDSAEKYIAASWALQQHGEVGYHLGQILEKRGKTEDAVHMYTLAAVADRTVPEAKESLVRLSNKEKADALLAKARSEFTDSAALKLGSLMKNLKEVIQAEFYVVLVPGASSAAEAGDVKFISGDEKLKSLAGAIKRAKYNLTFPDDTRTKLIRRGTLVCQPNGECSFFLLRPDYATSVD